MQARRENAPRARSRARRPRGLCAPFAAALVLCAALGSSCASIKFKQETETSGTFRSTGFSFVMLSIDIPKTAEQIARENAADAQLANTQVEEVFVFPYLGWFDWVVDFLGFRYARITGTWGFPGE